jgi:exodeoxyribonuclease VII large subunit
VIVLARGGGAAEDLASFNDERLARALAGSPVPTISAVGHETDWTLVDFIADLRAPTPSAAAELVVGAKEEIARRVGQARRSLAQLARRRLAEVRGRLASAVRAESLVRFRYVLMRRRDRLDAAVDALRIAALERPARLRTRVEAARRALASLGPLAVLKRGYAVVYRNGSESPLRSAVGVDAGTPLRIRLAEGRLRATVTEAAPEEEK